MTATSAVRRHFHARIDQTLKGPFHQLELINRSSFAASYPAEFRRQTVACSAQDMSARPGGVFRRNSSISRFMSCRPECRLARRCQFLLRSRSRCWAVTALSGCTHLISAGDLSEQIDVSMGWLDQSAVSITPKTSASVPLPASTAIVLASSKARSITDSPVTNPPD